MIIKVISSIAIMLDLLSHAYYAAYFSLDMISETHFSMVVAVQLSYDMIALLFPVNHPSALVSIGQVQRSSSKFWL